MTRTKSLAVDQALPDLSPSSEPGPRRCVLVVDDDPVFAALAEETLQGAGFDTVVAGTAAAAITTFVRDRPDLVLLDVDLPGGNGFSVCERLRTLSSGSDVPVVLVTGHDDTESIAKAYEVGATDFIQKPVLWPTLPHRVSFILRALDNLRALKTSEQKNRALVQALPDAILVVDHNGIVVEHIAGVQGLHAKRLVGRTIEQSLPATVATAIRQFLVSGTTKEVAAMEFAIGKGAERRWFEARLSPQSDGPLLIVIRDTTERRRAKARIEYLAYFDVLTKLPNRQYFVREAGVAIEAARRSEKSLALLYVDLDRFKRINDNLGHSVGDVLLKTVARRLEQSVLANDASTGTLSTAPMAAPRVARLGGDEFVVLLPEVVDELPAAQVAERIQRALAEPVDCGGHFFVITPSIGIAMYPADGQTIDELLAKADMAMYHAKERGRNGHVFFGQSMAVRSLGRLELESDLREAIAGNAFQLHYQPKLSIDSGEVIGVEALLRWMHPERGFVPPDTFIPLAEETGLINALGEWVIRNACKQLACWAAEGLGHLTIAVNVSVHQFAQEQFLSFVLNTLSGANVNPRCLELEITESLLMKNVVETIACLRRFRDAGITISIDDFGTGYSSLGYLRQFAIDALKIDRSFVKDLQQSDDAAAICSAIIAMARELKLKVIAEGVETTEQLAFLRHHRCDQAQGYLISRPLPIDTLGKRLRWAAGEDGAPPHVTIEGIGSES